jgi:hypothetical protein
VTVSWVFRGRDFERGDDLRLRRLDHDADLARGIYSRARLRARFPDLYPEEEADEPPRP